MQRKKGKNNEVVENGMKTPQKYNTEMKGKNETKK